MRLIKKVTGLIILGTASDVGKSYLTSAICRLLVNDGFKVLPFKSLNVTTNVVEIDDQLIIGQSTYRQALAAKVKPSPLMNPLLLKQTNGQMELALFGKVDASFKGSSLRKDFYYKGLEAIEYAIEQLAIEDKVIIFEGSGSTVELNLKDRELVNMKVAELANIPAILVANIDRGGVFASIVGTIELLSKSERERVKGIVINKFRGDPKLFADGVQIIEEKVNIPVIGVIPYKDSKDNSIDSEANYVKSFLNYNKLREIIFQPESS